MAMIGQFGINMLVPVLLCSFLGSFLDKKLGTSYLVIFLFFVGAAAGFRNVYRLARRISDRASSESAYLHTGRKKRQKEIDLKEGNHEKNHHRNEQDII